MSIPKKGSRIVRVDGDRYRWRVRNRPTYAQAIGQSNLMLAVEDATAAGGSVLVVNLPAAHPSNWMNLAGGSVTPAFVVEIVRRALGAGWRPKSSGDLFRWEVSETAFDSNGKS